LKIELTKAIGAILPTLKKNNFPEDSSKALFSSISLEHKTCVRITNEEERKLFIAPRDILLSQKLIAENQAEETVENALVKLYHKLLVNEAEIERLIDELLESFIQNTNQDYFVLSKIENIRILDDGDYRLIDCTLKKITETDLPFNEITKQFTPVGDKYELIGKPAIFTIVRAGDSEKAKELALHKFMISFNLLRLYAPNFKPALKGSLVSGINDLFAFNISDKVLSSSMSRTGELILNNAYIDKKLYETLKSEGINELQKDTSIAKVVKECLYWYGLGLDEKYPSARLINFVTVLETILKRKDEKTESTIRISEGGAVLLSNKFTERKEIVKQLKEVYKIRSTVVHTGVLIHNKNIASLSGGYARAVILKAIKLSKTFNGDFDDFITYLDDLKLKGDGICPPT